MLVLYQRGYDKSQYVELGCVGVDSTRRKYFIEKNGTGRNYFTDIEVDEEEGLIFSCPENY